MKHFRDLFFKELSDLKFQKLDSDSDDQLSIAGEWWNSLESEKQDSIIEWFNIRDDMLDQGELLLFYEYFEESEKLTFDICDDCETVFINTEGLDSYDWCNFQGVDYEGCHVYDYVYGHVDGDTPERGNICEECFK